MKATMDGTGRIELPGIVQTQLGIRPGDEVRFEPLKGAWIIRSVPRSRGQTGPELDGDDLSWPDLDYRCVAPRRIGQVKAMVQHRGRLKPMRIDLDES